MGANPVPLILNTSNQYYYIKKREKIAQLLIQPVIQTKIEEVSELS